MPVLVTNRDTNDNCISVARRRRMVRYGGIGVGSGMPLLSGSIWLWVGKLLGMRHYIVKFRSLF